MKMKNLYSLLMFSFIVFTISACTIYEPLATNQTDNNRSYKVDYLFKYEDMEFYRFRDSGNEVYFTIPTSSITSITQDSTKKRIMMIGGK